MRLLGLNFNKLLKSKLYRCEFKNSPYPSLRVAYIIDLNVGGSPAACVIPPHLISIWAMPPNVIKTRLLRNCIWDVKFQVDETELYRV